MPATATLTTYKMYIDGQWVDASSGNHFESDDPFRAEPWALIPRGNAADVDRAVRAAHQAFTSGEWPKLTASRRGALLRRLGDLITERSKQLAEIEVRDNGPGPGAPPTMPREGTGFGLRSVRERLAGHFGDRAELSLTRDESGTTTIARIVMPVVRVAA